MADTAYAPGVPCWVDLSTSDIEACTAFYGQLFGWEPQEAAPNTGGYRMFHYRGVPVAAAMPRMSDEIPTVWTTYFSVPDSAATAAAVRAAGGQAIVEPMEVMGQGTMSIFMDPTGAAFGCWQPAAFAGAGLTGEPNTFSWAELATRDPDGARRFYPQVFGWGMETSAFGNATYTEWQLGGRSIAGLLPMGPQFPPEVPPHWAVYFGVADIEASMAYAEKLGGTVLTPIMSADVGRFAALRDPQGGVFNVFQPAR